HLGCWRRLLRHRGQRLGSQLRDHGPGVPLEAPHPVPHARRLLLEAQGGCHLKGDPQRPGVVQRSGRDLPSGPRGTMGLQRARAGAGGAAASAGGLVAGARSAAAVPAGAGDAGDGAHCWRHQPLPDHHHLAAAAGGLPLRLRGGRAAGPSQAPAGAISPGLPQLHAGLYSAGGHERAKDHNSWLQLQEGVVYATGTDVRQLLPGPKNRQQVGCNVC
ncbi:unnamed protein product, partial [Effrenium voratum]